MHKYETTPSLLSADNTFFFHFSSFYLKILANPPRGLGFTHATAVLMMLACVVFFRVKLGVQMETKDHVAVKIIERSKIQVCLMK